MKMDPEQQEIIRNSDGTFPKGISGNPAGRPKGKSLKEFWRQRFANMTDEEKAEFSLKVDPKLLWLMAEGNPAQSSEHEVKGELIVRLINYDERSDDSTQLQTGEIEG